MRFVKHDCLPRRGIWLGCLLTIAIFGKLKTKTGFPTRLSLLLRPSSCLSVVVDRILSHADCLEKARLGMQWP